MDANLERLADLTFGLFMANHAWRRLTNDVLRKYNLSDATGRALLLLARQDGIRQGCLADLLGIEGPTLVRLVDALSKAGFVRRSEDPDDRRAKILRLTNAGKQVAVVANAAVSDLRARIFSTATASDVEACLRVLDCLGEGEIGADRAIARVA
jgi:MarR family transcriptional regulator, transcriptional regulator for hemolysin